MPYNTVSEIVLYCISISSIVSLLCASQSLKWNGKGEGEVGALTEITWVRSSILSCPSKISVYLCMYITIVYSMLISLKYRIPPIRTTIAANTMTCSSNAIGSTPSTRSLLTIAVMPAPRINLRLTVLCFMYRSP